MWGAAGVLAPRAEEAWTPRHALLTLSTEPFDVVIVDDQIPGFDVLEVTELLVAATRPARRRPAVVVVSAELDLSRRASPLPARGGAGGSLPPTPPPPPPPRVPGLSVP